MPETRSERRERIKKLRQEKAEKDRESSKAMWDPAADENAANDAYKTLFVARLNFLTDERKLKREFEVFGEVKSVRLVMDSEGAPRG